MGQYGGVLAAPGFRKIATRSLQYLGERSMILTDSKSGIHGAMPKGLVGPQTGESQKALRTMGC